MYLADEAFTGLLTKNQRELFPCVQCSINLRACLAFKDYNQDRIQNRIQNLFFSSWYLKIVVTSFKSHPP